MSEENSGFLIELKNISRTYGYGEATTFALKNFSLEVRRGEFIMIMGPSGCGKSTLLNVIGLLDKPTNGTYLLNGRNVASLSSRKKSHIRAKDIGYIFQNFNLIPDLTVIENVALPLIYSGKTKTRRLKNAAKILETFHLENREYFLPYQLSGGQQQRVCIARSLVNQPEIILADEPTGNLDSRSSHIVMEELREIHSRGNTIIMVTHNPQLTTYATRVIHMLDGNIDVDIKTVSDDDLPQLDNTAPEGPTVQELSKNESKTPENPKTTEEPKPLQKTETPAEVPEKVRPPKTVPAPLGEIVEEPVKHNAFPIVGSSFQDHSIRTTHKPTIEDLILETKKGKK